MDNRYFQASNGGADTFLLSSLLVDLNIARRNSRSYPHGHPVVASSLEKVLASYDLLLRECPEISIGVARDHLIVNDLPLEKTNPVFRDFARVLFDRGIAALVLRPGIGLGELKNFIHLLGLKREDIQQQGGIAKVWLELNLTTLSIRTIRYDLFSVTSLDATGVVGGGNLWERFARSIVRDQEGGKPAPGEELEPELVAAILNGQLQHRITPGESAECVDALARLMRRIASGPSDKDEKEQSLQKIGELVSRLNPELRRQFLESSFSGEGQEGDAEVREVLSHLSVDAMVEILDDVNSRRTRIPPVVVGLLQRFSRQAGEGAPPQAGAAPEEPDTEKMRILFREHVTEEFTPEEYQLTLNRIVTGEPLPRFQGESSVDELLKTLDPHFVESGIGEIILQLMLAQDEGADEALVRNLEEMRDYFLETGEYGRLLHMFEQITGKDVPAAWGDVVRGLLSERTFFDEVMDGLVTWGKPKFDQIAAILRLGGAAAAEPLLDRLAAEESMSLRRFIIDRLIEIGPLAREAAIRRLNDSRWYVLRNLLIILRSMNDPALPDLLRPLLGHEDRRVRQEVVRILLHYREAGAEKQLLTDLEGGDSAAQLTAIGLAPSCPSPQVLERLVTLLNRPGFSAGDCELKSAVIRALGEIGRPEVLPALAKILGASSMLNARPLSRLKGELIASLASYPRQIVLPILQRLSAGRDEIGRQAAEVLRKVEVPAP